MYTLTNPWEPDESPSEMTKSTSTETAPKRFKGPRLSLHKKRKVIRMYNAGRRQSLIAKHFRVPIETVAQVVRNQHKYGGKTSAAMRDPENRMRFNEDKLVHLEAMLAGWFKLARHWDMNVTRADVKEKALLFNDVLKGPDNFNANQGWQTRFTKRFALALPDQRKVPADDVYRCEQDIKQQIYNCVEEILLRAQSDKHKVFGIKALREFGWKWIKDFMEVQEKIKMEEPADAEEDEAYKRKIKETWERKLQLMAVDLQFLLLRF